MFRSRDEETTHRIRFMMIERRRTDRIIHCPGITLDIFKEGAAALTEEGYKDMFALGDRLKDALKGSHEVHITCPPWARTFPWIWAARSSRWSRAPTYPPGRSM